MREDCRLCGNKVGGRLELLPTPIANGYTKGPNEGEFYPLELVECVSCRHVQNKHVLEGLFEGYKYRTPQTPFLDESAKELKKLFPDAKVVVEIGSNNGSYLNALHNYFDTVIGVDPAGEPPTFWIEPFTLSTAKRIKKRVGRVDLVIGNNVFAHIDNLDEVFEGINYLTDNVVMEFQYFHEMVNRGIYDTIYHEHLDQHTLAPLALFLDKYDFKISAEQRLDSHGGSCRVICKRESNLGIQEFPVNWELYKERIRDNQETFLDSLPDEFCLWGAPAKATTMIHQLNIKDRIKYCVDTTKQKQGLYLPGTAIQIIPDFIDDLPRVLAAWNYNIGGEDVIRPYRFCA